MAARARASQRSSPRPELRRHRRNAARNRDRDPAEGRSLARWGWLDRQTARRAGGGTLCLPGRQRRRHSAGVPDDAAGLARPRAGATRRGRHPRGPALRHVRGVRAPVPGERRLADAARPRPGVPDAGGQSRLPAEPDPVPAAPPREPGRPLSLLRRLRRVHRGPAREPSDPPGVAAAYGSCSPSREPSAGPPVARHLRRCPLVDEPGRRLGAASRGPVDAALRRRDAMGRVVPSWPGTRYVAPVRMSTARCCFPWRTCSRTL